MNTDKLDIEKLARSPQELQEGFFSEMQKNVFDKIAKLEEEANLAVKKKRLRIMRFTGVAASIALIMGVVCVNVKSYDVDNSEELLEEFNFYGDYLSNQEMNNYSSMAMDEEYDGVFTSLSSQELEEEIEKYKVFTYLDYLY